MAFFFFFFFFLFFYFDLLDAFYPATRVYEILGFRDDYDTTTTHYHCGQEFFFGGGGEEARGLGLGSVTARTVRTQLGDLEFDIHGLGQIQALGGLARSKYAG